MRRPRKPSPQTRLVLEELASDVTQWQYGYDLAQRTSLASGTLYPILVRLTERGNLEAKWEEPEGGRPPRHLYRLTATGIALAATVRDESTGRAHTTPAAQPT